MLPTCLVRAGIDSISVNPDSFLAVKRCVAEVEALSS
jgi:phosphoenolpyruvate synthase/pyruvate phosphate dikinase